jgi:hypothetical protein
MRTNLHGKMLPGEEEARRTGTIKTIRLVPKRTSEFGDVGEYHFRYAESQFLRYQTQMLSCILYLSLLSMAMCYVACLVQMHFTLNRLIM